MHRPAPQPWWSLALAAALLAGLAGCSGGGGIPVQTVTLATGLGTLERVVVSGSHAFVTERSGAATRIVAVPLTPGATAVVVTAAGAIPSLTPYGAGCLYIDEVERTISHAAAGSAAPTVLSRSGTQAPRAVAAGDGVAFWIDGSGTRLVALALPDDPGATDPPPPISFPEVVATVDDATLLAVGSDRVWLADQGGARVSSVALTGGTPSAAAAGLGAVRDLGAFGASFLAASPGGLQVGGAGTPLPGSAAPLVVSASTAGAVVGASGAVYLRGSATSLGRVVGTDGLADLDASGLSLVIAENAAAGGRVRLVTLPAPEV